MEVSPGIYSVVITDKMNLLKPYVYLVSSPRCEMPRLGEPQALSRKQVVRFAPWSEDVPDSCRVAGKAAWPLVDETLVDVGPHALDEE